MRDGGGMGTEEKKRFQLSIKKRFDRNKKNNWFRIVTKHRAKVMKQ
jgi:hypothetical protein